jgi:hypothetical protein
MHSKLFQITFARRLVQYGDSLQRRPNECWLSSHVKLTWKRWHCQRFPVCYCCLLLEFWRRTTSPVAIVETRHVVLQPSEIADLHSRNCRSCAISKQSGVKEPRFKSSNVACETETCEHPFAGVKFGDSVRLEEIVLKGKSVWFESWFDPGERSG